MRATEVLIFGNPAEGTHLMLSRQGSALGLPLRVAVRREPDGTVSVDYRAVPDLAQRYGIGDRKDIIAVMRTSLAAALKHSTVPY